jgi:tRNA uridine 5-carboxymethylaminomethyl modification enzyme
MRKVEGKQKNCEQLASIFRNESMDPLEINPVLEKAGSSLIQQKVKLGTLLSRPNLSLVDFEQGSANLALKLEMFSEEEKEQAEIQLKYEGYIEREKEMAAKHQRLENIRLHDDLDFRQLSSLSAEAREKLSNIRPATLGQASRISGVSPADISVLLVYLGR